MYSKDTGKDQMLMTMERALTSGQKAGFFFLGFLGGIVGILAASLMNINAPYRPEGTKMAALGFATACVLGTLIALQVVTAFQGIRELAAVYVFACRVARAPHLGKAAVVCRCELV